MCRLAQLLWVYLTKQVCVSILDSYIAIVNQQALLDAAHRSSTHRVTREEDNPSSLCAQRLEKTNRVRVDGSRPPVFRGFADSGCSRSVILSCHYSTTNLHEFTTLSNLPWIVLYLNYKGPRDHFMEAPCDYHLPVLGGPVLRPD
jgi:hypothetical protein